MVYGIIEDWREETHERHYKNSSLLTINVLPDEAISRLARLKLPLSAAGIRAILVESWPRWDCHGEELMQRLLAMPMSQPTLPTKRKRGRTSQHPTPARSEGRDPSHTPTEALSHSVPWLRAHPVLPSTPAQLQNPQPSNAGALPNFPFNHNTPLMLHPPMAPAQQLPADVSFCSASRPQAHPVPPATPVRLQNPMQSSAWAPYSRGYPPTSFSPVVMYHHPSLAGYPTGPTTFGGSFSYQDLANMANTSFRHPHHPGAFTHQVVASPVTTAPYAWPPHGPPPS